MINEAGIKLIKEFEGLRLTAYQCPAGVWTIGYGHTQGVTPGQTISAALAESMLRTDVVTYASAVVMLCTERPNENQMAAMTSLAYNIGIGAFTKSSVLRLHNAGKFAEAASAFSMWNKAGGKVRAGLTRRRAAEMALYLTPVANEKQTTRARPEVKDPAAKVSGAAVAASAGAALTAAQQGVAQVSSIWDGLSALGINPHVLMAVLGSAAIVALGWFLWDAYRRNQEGDR